MYLYYYLSDSYFVQSKNVAYIISNTSKSSFICADDTLLKPHPRNSRSITGQTLKRSVFSARITMRRRLSFYPFCWSSKVKGSSARFGGGVCLHGPAEPIQVIP